VQGHRAPNNEEIDEDLLDAILAKRIKEDESDSGKDFEDDRSSGELSDNYNGADGQGRTSSNEESRQENA
jgi:hypothetical protein